MQSIQFYQFCKLFLIILLSEVNCYLDSELRLDNWTPSEQIKFNPRKNEELNEKYRRDEERNVNRYDTYHLLNVPEKDNYRLNDRMNEANMQDGIENRQANEIVNHPEYHKLNKKEQDNVLNLLTSLDNLKNKTQKMDDKHLDAQYLIWFLIFHSKIIPTTTKLNQFLCNANNSTELCTSFNQLHVLVGKSKRNSNDETFRKARLIENLSDKFDELTQTNKFNNKYKRFNQNNLDKKFDIKLDSHTFNHQFNHRHNHNNNFGNHFKSSHQINEFKKSAYPFHLDRLINSKSIYKHHQRLKRNINNLVDQFGNQNRTFDQAFDQHQLIKRNLDNEIKYPDIQQFGKFRDFYFIS